MNISRAFEVFHADVADQPPLTLRGANAVDSYSQPMPFDPAEDDPSDAYLEGLPSGVSGISMLAPGATICPD